MAAVQLSFFELFKPEKKPVLISCGFAFPAGISTERGGGCTCVSGRSLKHKKKLLPLPLFSLISFLAYFHTPLSFYLPLMFLFVPRFLLL